VRQSWAPILLVILLGGAGCRASLSSYMKNAELHPKFANKRYIIRTATGATVDVARDNARRSIGEQISLSLRSETERTDQYFTGSDGEEWATRYREKLNTLSVFLHAELVEFDDSYQSEVTLETGGAGWVVFAYLDRNRFRDALASDAKQALDELVRLRDRVRQPRELEEFGSLRADQAIAADLKTKIDVFNVQSLVASGRILVTDHTDVFYEISSTIEKAQASLGFCVDAHIEGPVVGGAIMAAVTNVIGRSVDAVSRLGLKATTGTCDSGDPLGLVVKLETAYDLAELGYWCRASWQFTLSECASGKSLVTLQQDSRPIRALGYTPDECFQRLSMAFNEKALPAIVETVTDNVRDRFQLIHR